MGSSMTTAEGSNTEDSSEMATPTKESLEHLKVAISKLENPQTAAFGCDQVCQSLPKCLKDQVGQEAALHLVEQALLKYGAELKNPRGNNKSNSAAAKLLEMVFPLMWVDKQSVREVALRIVKMIPTDPRPECWSKLKTDMHTVYCKSLLNMVITMQKDWPNLWMETVKFFGNDLHSGAHLINQLLGVLEKAYKNPDVGWTRIQAFECWKALIDSFKKVSLNSKRITLILIPLKASNHRTEQLTKAKYETFLHLIASMPKAQDLYETLKAFLTFCFNSTGEVLLPLGSYPSLQPLCFEALEIAVTRACESKCVQRLSNQIIVAFSQCLQLPHVDEETVKKAWMMLLKNIWEAKAADANRDLIREMLTMLDDLVASSAGMPRSPTVSPGSSSSISSMSMNLSQSSSPPQEELGSVLAVLIYELVVGTWSLTSSQLASVSLYIGNDVMTGTPALMAVQWLLSPGILLSTGCTQKYKTMMNRLINTSVECLGGPLSFIPKVLKLATRVISSQSDSTKVAESLTATWCSMAEVLVRWVNAGGELNQGDAANHDFSCLYATVHFPITHLFTNTSSWIKVWGQLYHKSAPQVALVSTTDSHEFCDEIVSRLTAAVKSDSPKNRDSQLAAIVACGEAMVRAHKSTHTKWGREQDNVVALLSDVAANATGSRSDELLAALARCVAQLENPVPLSGAAPQIVEKLSPVVLLLLQHPSPSQHLAQQFVSALVALKAILEKHWHSPSNAPEEVKAAVGPVVTCAKSHAVLNIRTTGNSLASSICGLVPDESSFSDVPTMVVGSVLHPPKDIVGSKTAEKKTNTPKKKTTPNKISFSPLNKSPADTPTRRNKRKLEDAMEQFVVIKRPTPVKMVLTEHQKEVMRRKADIPALYQDLSQDTQNATQDCVILPSSPAVPPKKARIEPEEAAVMDFEDIVPFRNAGKDLDSSVSILEEDKSKKVYGTIEIDDNATMQSVSDANDDVLTCSQESEMAVRLEDEPVQDRPPPVTPNRRKSIVPVKKEPTVTRSRNMNNLLVTRSGKLVRQSLGNMDFKSPPKVKRQRKSMPSARSESESSDEKPAEARSPMKALARGRGSRVASKVTDSSESVLESSKSSDETLSAASPSESTERSNSSDSSVTSESTAKVNPIFASPPSVRERPRRKTTPTRIALLLFQEHDNAERISQTVGVKGAKASKAELPKPDGRTLRRNRSKNSFDEDDPKPAETEVPGDITDKTEVTSPLKSVSPRTSPLKCGVDPVVVLEKLTNISTSVEIPETDSETLTQPTEPLPEISSASPEGTTVPEPEENSVLESEALPEPEKPAEAVSEPVEAPAAEVAKDCGSIVPSAEVIPESQDIIESSQAPEESLGITTPRYTESPKRDETPNSAKWTLRVSDTFTPVDSATNASPAPSTPKGAPADERDAEKVPRRLLGENDDRSDSMPSWMHAKKVVSPGKPSRLVAKRVSPADRVKSTPEESASGSSPPKLSEPTPASSPVQSKWTRTEAATPTGRSPGSFPMRTGRAAHLLGLGQAAAARSGEEIRTTLSPSRKEETATTATPPPTVAEPAAAPAAAPAPSAVMNPSNGLALRATLNGNAIASPRVRRRTRMGLSSRFSDGGQAAKEPLTPGAEWIKKNYQPDATPESGILKKPRRTPAILDSDGSPSNKKKRVSFHDPPVSKSLNFYLTSEEEYAGTVHSSDALDEPSSGKPPILEERKQESGVVKWMKAYEEEKQRDNAVAVIVEETEQEMERESRPNLEESSILKQRNYDDKGDHIRLVSSKEDKTKRRDGGEKDDADENRWSDSKIRKDDERVGKDDVSRWKMISEEDDDVVMVEDERLRKEEEDRLRKTEEEESLRKEVEERARKEEEERIRVEEEERVRKEEEEERVRKEEEERVCKEEEERVRKEEEERVRKEEEERVCRENEERVRKEEEERVRKEGEERVRKEEEERVRKEEEERVRKEEEERVRRDEEERVRREEEEKEWMRKMEEERIRKQEEEEMKRAEEERVRSEEKKRKAEEKIRKEEERKRKAEEKIRKEKEEKKRKAEERILKEEEEKKCKEEERIRKEKEERKRKEEERIRKEKEEKKRKEEEERILKEEEEKKRKEEERIREEEERKREEERIRKEEERKCEEERIRKEKEEQEERKREEERIWKEKEQEEKNREDERIRKEEEKRVAEERIKEEEEKRQEAERKEQEEKKRVEDETLRKEEEERLRLAEGIKLEEEKKRKAEGAMEQERLKLKRKESSHETNKISDDSRPLKKSARIRNLRSDSEESSSSSQQDEEIIVIPGGNSENTQETVRKTRGRPKKRNDDEIRRRKEEERKQMAEELEKSDAEWSRKEEIRLGVLCENAGPSAVSNGTVSKVSRGPRVDSDLSQIAALSQGDASVTHPVLFSKPGAVYPSLVDCEEPVDKIIEGLTGAAWRRNLLRKFTDANLTTIGHLASLTEEQVNRYSIRPPRKETLVSALEKYERSSGKISTPVKIPKPQTPGRDYEDDLPLSCLTVTSQAVPLEPVNPVTAIPTNTLLNELTKRIGVHGILKQLFENSEAEVKKLLPKASLEDLVEECSTRINNTSEFTACNGKLIDLVTNAVAKDAILKRTASALVSKSNGKEILETLFKSVLDQL